MLDINFTYIEKFKFKNIYIKENKYIYAGNYNIKNCKMSGTFVLADMEFPEFGKVCPVSGCAGSTFFRKFDHLKKHWLQFHQRLVTFHKCSICETVFGAKRDGGKHIRSHHGQRGCLTSFTKVNCRFMSPGEVTLPSKEEVLYANKFDCKGAGCSSAIADYSDCRKLSSGGPKSTGS